MQRQVPLCALSKLSMYVFMTRQFLAFSSLFAFSVIGSSSCRSIWASHRASHRKAIFHRFISFSVRGRRYVPLAATRWQSDAEPSRDGGLRYIEREHRAGSVVFFLSQPGEPSMPCNHDKEGSEGLIRSFSSTL